VQVVLEASGLEKVYLSGDNKTHAVREMSLSIGSGESVAITGPSGCGKTTLINLLGLVIRPTQGQLLIDSVDSATLTPKQRARHRNQVFGYVVQDFALIEDLTAYHNVEIPLLYRQKRGRAKDKKGLILAALDQVGLKGKEFVKAKNLSGGERQRVAIARAIVNSPRVILADEPTGSLDSKSAKEIMGLLHSLVHAGKTLVLVTHDQALADQCSRQIRMADGMAVNS
jgi:putative ABC transport system ATP-binding protein